MNWQSVLVAVIIGAILVTIIVRGIIKKKNGTGGCSCGGSCGACGMCHSEKTPEKK